MGMGVCYLYIHYLTESEHLEGKDCHFSSFSHLCLLNSCTMHVLCIHIYTNVCL